MPTVIVDCHSHLYPPEWAPSGRMPAEMFDIDALHHRQDEAGVATSIVSDPHIWYGDLEPAAIERTREYNDHVADLMRHDPARLVGLGTVTPWRGDDHLAEAERAIDNLGLAGLAMATSDRGSYLDTIPEEFWKWINDRDVPIFLHPGGTVVGQELMGTYRLGEVCGRPLDTTLTLARFILMGFMERFPRIRMLCSHAGGAITAIADRLDFGHELRDYAPLGPWGDVRLNEPPSAFVARLYLDTVTYGPALVRLALEHVGSGHVLYGSDNPPVPFPLTRTIAVIRALGLPPEDEARLLGGNAAALFGLGASQETGRNAR